MADFATMDIVFDKLPKLQGEIRRIGMEALEKGGFDIEARAKANASAMGAVDTGHMMNSVYTSGEHSDYKSSGPRGAYLPEEPHGQDEVVVGVAADYGLYVDFGTSKMPGRPFFSEAVYHVRGELEHVLGEIVEKGIEEALS